MNRKVPAVLIVLLLAACAHRHDENSDEGAQASDSSSTLSIHVRTSAGNYLVADQGGGATLMAYSTWAEGWETFTLHDLNGGALSSGDIVTLRGGQGQWASADNGGGGAITLTAPWERGWEQFRIVKLTGGGTIGDGDGFALQTTVGGQYVSVINGGGGDVTATAPWTRGWETLTLQIAGASAGGGGGGGGSTGATALEQLLSQSTFESMFPDRNAFYTYDGLVQAAATYPAFASTGSLDDRKREIAALLANVNRETGALVYVEEIDKADYVNSASGCDPEPGKRYYGRGPIQLSWTTNYCSASAAIFGSSDVLRADPDRVARESWVAWATGLWYWMSTCHDPMTSGQGFGATVRAINGPVECDGRIPSAVDDRVQAYLRFCQMLGVDPGGNLYC
jgi:hypothetical protein